MERYSRIAAIYSSTGGGGAADEALKAAAREAVSLAHGMNVFQEESMAQFRHEIGLQLIPHTHAHNTIERLI
jgi:hypothetical protein